MLKELIDLGLPIENCEAIAKAYKENKERLRLKKEKQFPRSIIPKIYFIFSK